jgi:hypothetical protein
MQFYVHHINPHYAATWADTYFEGWHYGIGWQAAPPVEPQFFELQCQSLAAVRDLTEQLERKGHTLGEAQKPASGSSWPAGPSIDAIRNAPPL